MLHKHAYLNADNIVVQVISGAVEGVAHDALLRDYGVLFGAVRCVQVSEDTPVWIGGKYEQGTFLPAVVEQPIYVYDSSEIAATNVAEIPGEIEA